MLHWTYDAFRPSDDLEQGDILECNDALREVLRVVHPHFCDEKYLGFIVVSQSCDLVRRGGASCATAYINIATIRSLQSVRSRLISSEIEPVAPGLYRNRDKVRARMLLQRVLSQNEQGRGLFYLHPLPPAIGESALAHLRVSVALRREHYGILTGARRGRLHPEYRAKFGWLAGNLYARPATRDWGDFENGEAQLNELIEELLDGTEDLQWIEDARVDALPNEVATGPEAPRASVLEALRKVELVPSTHKLASFVADDVHKAMLGLKSEREELGRRVAQLFARSLGSSVSKEGDESRESESVSSTERELALGNSDPLGESSRLEEADRIIEEFISQALLKKVENRIKNNGKIKKLLR